MPACAIATSDLEHRTVGFLRQRSVEGNARIVLTYTFKKAQIRWLPPNGLRISCLVEWITSIDRESAFDASAS
jgi:hypothetical protein